MKLQYLGHSCFRLISDMGTTIVCDPYNGKMVGFDMPRVRCDAVTVSHHHADHDCLDAIIGNPAVLDVVGVCTADDIAVASYETYHDDAKGAKRGKNIVFTFVADGIKVVHMGDVGCLDEQLAATVAGCDVLLLPVGGTFTVDAQGAKWYVDKVKPKIVVPMHYRTAEHAFNIDGVDAFLSLFDTAVVQQSDRDCLVLDDVPAADTFKIVVLQRFVD